MAAQIQNRHLGDTEVAIATTLQRPGGNAVDLTNTNVRFKMTDAAGTLKVAETNSNVQVTDASNGEVQYDPQSADVDTAGTYHAYFTVEDADGNKDTFPAIRGDLEVRIYRD
ncbi:MAG: BppU family phage baseplate upper protein [Burkholderiales bacterium]|nr:BppU family phage baseplate upper protein [Burkholderiales bacterium]